jgi:hypothetical protein
MDSVMFLDCPAYMDQRGTARCGLPAAVEGRYTVTSTDGPLESARIRCPRGHYFNGPLESLTWQKAPSAAPPAVTRMQPRDAIGERMFWLMALRMQTYRYE